MHPVHSETLTDSPEHLDRFKLKDGLLLLLAIAVGLAINRVCWPLIMVEYLEFRDQQTTVFLPDWFKSACLITYFLTLPHLWSLSGLIVFVAVQQGGVLRQPGVIACLIGFSLTSVLAAGTAITRLREEFVAHEFLYDIGHGVVQMDCCPGCAIAGGWFVLLLTGQWDSKRSWFDRLGRGVGVLWLVQTLSVVTEDWWWSWMLPR